MRVTRRILVAGVSALLISGVAHAARGHAGRGGKGSGSAGKARLATVLSVDSSTASFTIQGNKSSNSVVVTTDSATVFSKSDGTAASFSDLVEGVKVSVQGSTSTTDGVTTIAATSVTIGAPAGGNGNRCDGSGTVTSVDAAAGTFVVQPDDSSASPVTVTTTSSTIYVNADGSTASLADVVVGAHVRVEGSTTGTNSVAATRVLIGTPSAGEGRSCAGSGTVTSVDSTAGTFVVQPDASDADPVTVITTADTVYVNADGSAASFADVAAGVRVRVEGTAGSDGSVTATRITIGVASGHGGHGSRGGHGH